MAQKAPATPNQVHKFGLDYVPGNCVNSLIIGSHCWNCAHCSSAKTGNQARRNNKPGAGILLRAHDRRSFKRPVHGEVSGLNSSVFRSRWNTPNQS